MLVGEPGVGRTRLARAASSQVSGVAGWFTVTGDTPFGPFARLLVGRADAPLVDRFPAATDELVRSGHDVLVVVDDAHRLDDLSLAFLHHLVDTSRVRLLLTASTDAEVSPLLARLWKDGVIDRLPLQPLGPTAIADLVAAALPGTVDRDLARWLTTTSAGNPLLLRELLADALERDAIGLDGGRWQRRGPAGPPTARLREVVGVRQGSLTADERAAAVLLAVGGQLPLAVLEHLTSPDAVVGLERRELLVVLPDPRRVEVALAHPVHAEVLLGELGPLQLRAHLRSLVAGLEATDGRRRDDRYRLAQWRVRLGDVTDWRAVLDVAREVAGTPQREVAEVASGAATRPGWGRTHLLTALELAQAAEQHGGGFEAALVVRGACRRLGHLEGVAAADARLDELATTDDERAAIARLRAGDEAPSMTGAEGKPAQEAAALAVEGRPEDALGAAAVVLDDVSATSNDRVLAAAASAGALCQLGRTAEAADVASEALRAVGEHDAPGTVWALVIAHLYALLLGGRLREAETLASSCREAAARTGSDDGVAGIEVALASVALAQGRPVTTVRWTTAALEKLTDAEMRRAAFAVEAHAVATLGDGERAAAILDGLDADPSRYIAIGPQLLRARAWAEVAAGRVSAAVTGLVEAADACRAASASVGELGLLHDVARLGQPHLVVDRVAEVVAGMDDLLPPAVLAHVVAIRDDDGGALEGAAEQFAAMGAAVLEAEAWAQAAGSHRRAGANLRATAA
ncbi:MAG: LuxR family transcriptional regulator fused with ATPase domain, partial [Actinomycetia bacterium]|nr:LuxR family transcriptional regulator fused with ATPase domain [Actinomycetes bacterium]